jgi:hypothetical protein
MLQMLEGVSVATDEELLALIDRRSLHGRGRGCGYVDLSLLASALLSDRTLLWTCDKRLESAASELGLSYRPMLQA